MTQASRTKVLYAVTEASPGTGETIAQATDNAIRVTEVTFSVGGEGLEKRPDTVNPFGLPASPVQGGKFWDISITAQVQDWSDVTDLTTNPLAPLIRACSEAADSVTYAGVDSVRLRWGADVNAQVAPCTIELHEIGGNRYRAVGARGTMTLSGENAGKMMLAKFELKGAYVTPVASTFTEAATDYGDATVDRLPLTFCGATLTSAIRRSNGSTEATISGLASFELVPGVEVTERPDATALASFCYGPAFVSRSGESDTLAFTCDAGPESDASDGLRAWASWVEQARGRTLTMSMNQGVGASRIDIVMADAHYDVPALNEGSAFRQYDLTAFNVAGETPAVVEVYFLAGS